MVETQSALRRLACLCWVDARIAQPWLYKAPHLLGVLHAHVALGALGWNAAGPAFVASVCTIAGLAGLAYVANDLADREADRRAGKPNLLSSAGPGRTAALAAGLALAAFGPWFAVLPLEAPGRVLLALQLALVAAYSLPPLRLKERGLAGVFADALYAHAVPALLATLTYRAMADGPLPTLPRFAVPLVAWQFALGVRNIVLHQLADLEHDRRSGLRTWVTQHGTEAAWRGLRRVVVPLELASFAAFLAALAPAAPLLLPSFALRSLWIARSKPVDRSDLRATLYAYLDPFYVRWLPLLLIAAAVPREPAFVALLLVQAVGWGDGRFTLRGVLDPACGRLQPRGVASGG
jgi:4-hydroxybenzoate polyprenyltransferase